MYIISSWEIEKIEEYIEEVYIEKYKKAVFDNEITFVKTTLTKFLYRKNLFFKFLLNFLKNKEIRVLVLPIL